MNYFETYGLFKNKIRDIRRQVENSLKIDINARILIIQSLQKITQSIHDNINTASPHLLFSATIWKQRLVFWAGAVLIGIVIVLLINLSEWSGSISRNIYNHSVWFSFLLAPIGLALTAWITYRFFPGSENSGIPQVKTALEIDEKLEERSRLVSIRIAIGKILLPIMGLFSGASVGLGGPSVQIGASIMASLGKAVRFPAHYLEKGLILAGSAAGFAAMFSAPLTGIVFAIEELGRALEEQISSLVLTAIIFSGITTYAFLNTYIFFYDRSLVLPWGLSWMAVPLCGIIAGLVGGLFSTIIIEGGKALSDARFPIVKIAFICGLVIAVTATLSGGVTLGTGYQETKEILNDPSGINPFYPLLKMIATIATAFSGIPSGIFVPSLSISAGLGANLADWFPIAPPTAMVLLAMAGYFSGMLQSPITSFVLIMEITDAHEFSIPLMATAFIAAGASKLICQVPLYRALCDTYTPNKEQPKTEPGQSN